MSGEKVCIKLSVAGMVGPGLGMFVVGSCPQLGEWKSKHAIPLERIRNRNDDYAENSRSVWEGNVCLPKGSLISYRYFIGNLILPVSKGESIDVMADDIEVIVWETNIHPRVINTTEADEMQLPQAEFGTYDGFTTTSQGWLENHDCMQVRFHHNPISMFKHKHRRQKYSIKCSPVDYEPGSTDMLGEDSLSGSIFCEESSLEGPPPCQKTAMVYYKMKKQDLSRDQDKDRDELLPAAQPHTGCVYERDDYLVFIARGINQQYLGFQLDFYVHTSSAEPRYVGSGHLLPPKMEQSLFMKNMPIIGLNHRPIGQVQVELLQVSPLPQHQWLMDVSYQNHWKNTTTLHVGHRGMGSSYKKVTSAKENTIRSLHAASEFGAAFVELDVLLSRDLVPVIYHDFSVCLATPLKNQAKRRMVEIAAKDLTLDQLQSMKMFHHSSGPNESDHIEITAGEQADSDFRDQPFPTLKNCLEEVDPKVGFNIEIKYPQALETGEHEQEGFFDINMFVDRILTVVFKYAGNRKIIFSSFHADACIMVNLKQNKYPMLFLNQGPTRRYTPYKDWRCSTFDNGIQFAKAEGLLGVNLQAEGLLQDFRVIEKVQSLGLVLFVWGEDLNEDKHKELFKEHKVDAIIFDRIGQNHQDQFVLESATPSLMKMISQGESPSSSMSSDHGCKSVLSPIRSGSSQSLANFNNGEGSSSSV